MLRKCLKSNDNMSDCVNLMLKGAKKRRSMALAAVKTLNTEMGFSPNMRVVK